ncbi:MAG: hypothetical protein K9K64_04525 [Desulfohalobiaceae bacterium]|nr:hypothetical protein [Desulfohalobiaceae bacterium]
MDNGSFLEPLSRLREVILEERLAARELAVDKMLEITEKKEELLKEMLPLMEAADTLTPEEHELAETVHSENLRNAYFFWSALNWVRESMGFIRDHMYPEAYAESGSKVKGRYSGTLLSGRV